MDVRAKDLRSRKRLKRDPSACGLRMTKTRGAPAPLLFFRLRNPILTAMLFRTDPPAPILTPCIGICTLDANGLCAGCFRTGDEIAAWRTMDDEERRRIMEDVLPAREAACR